MSPKAKKSKGRKENKHLCDVSVGSSTFSISADSNCFHVSSDKSKNIAYFNELTAMCRHIINQSVRENDDIRTLKDILKVIEDGIKHVESLRKLSL